MDDELCLDLETNDVLLVLSFKKNGFLDLIDEANDPTSDENIARVLEELMDSKYIDDANI